MIELTANTACMIYLGITLILLLSLWMYHHFRTKRKPVFTLEEKLTVCEYCQFAYLAPFHKKISQCPQCKAYNNKD